MRRKFSKGIMITAFVVAVGIIAGMYWFLLSGRNAEKMPARGIFVFQMR